MSTTSQGNAFRDTIKNLLDLCPRLMNVQQEIQIGHQDVDVYYEELTSTSLMRVACECKDYAEPLTRADLEKIYAKYNPLLHGNNQVIDAVRVFAPRPLGANAQAYLKQAGFGFSTLDELELTIIDFRAYLKSAVSNSKCNELIEVSPVIEVWHKQFCRTFEAKTFTGSSIELPSDLV